MRLKNFLITVEDIEKSVNFYKELFGMQVLRDFDGNVILSDGLVLQDKKIWEGFIGKEVTGKANDAELYFETKDLDAFQAKLDLTDIEFEYVNEMMEHSWGQKIIRIYDPDGHIIEVGEEFNAEPDEDDEPEEEYDENNPIPGTTESFIKNSRADVNLDALFEVEHDNHEEVMDFVNGYSGVSRDDNTPDNAPEWEDYWDDQSNNDEEDEFAEENY